MKKIWGFLALSLVFLFLMPAEEGGSVDLVLVLDTSSSMSGSYREVAAYITGPFLREFLRIGDTFHLVSFSDAPRAEISRRVEAAGDVETIIGRMLLMYPLDIYSDIPGALEYSERYVASLPGERPKKVVFISDGDHSPGPGSPRSGLDAAAVQKSIADTGSRLRQRGADFYFVKVPLVGSGPSSGRPWQTVPSSQTRQAQAGRSGAAGSAAQPGSAAQGSAAQPGSAAQGAAGQAGSAGRSGATGSADQGAAAQAGSAAQAGQPGSADQGATAQAGSAAQAGQPGSADQGAAAQAGSAAQAGQPGSADQGATVQAGSAGQPGSSGQAGSAAQGAAGQAGSAAQTGAAQAQAGGGQAGRPGTGISGTGDARGLPSLPLLIGLILGALLVAAGIVVFARRLQNSPNKAIASAAESRRGVSRDGAARDDSANRNAELLASYAANQRQGAAPASSRRVTLQDSQTVFLPTDGPPMLSLFVEGQNTSIGRRNIHAAKGGVTYSVGGGASDFFIFLVPMPAHIADIHFDGNQCTFIPRKPQFFPDIGSQTVPNCIGKAIRVLSDKKYEFFIRIDRYQDPLVALNRLMHSVKVPEK
jgi:hypothetical protein